MFDRVQATREHSAASTSAELRSSPVHTGPSVEAHASRAASVGHRFSAGSSSSGAPIQRLLTLEGGKEQHEVRRQNIADLNRILKGSGARIKVRKGGRIQFARRPKTREGNDHPGYRLVQSLIDHRHHVRLGYQDGEDDAKQKVDDAEAASLRKQGSGGRIALSQDAAAQSVVNRGGNLEVEDTPRYLILAHELIHAHRAAHGRRETEGRVEYPVRGNVEGRPLAANYGSRREEAETVGLVDSGHRGLITENDIRAAHRENPRAVYEGNVDDFLQWARHRTQPRPARRALTIDDLNLGSKVKSSSSLSWL